MHIGSPKENVLAGDMFLRITTLLSIAILLTSCNLPSFATAVLPTPTLDTPVVQSELTVAFTKPVYTTREPITATLTWKVTQGWILAMTWFMDNLDFNLSLVDSKGEPVPHTREADLYLGGSRTTYRLDAGQQPFITELDIRRWFNVSAPGLYTLTVTTRNVLDSSAMRAGLEKQTKVVSQPVTFAVVLL